MEIQYRGKYQQLRGHWTGELRIGQTYKHPCGWRDFFNVLSPLKHWKRHRAKREAFTQSSRHWHAGAMPIGSKTAFALGNTSFPGAPGSTPFLRKLFYSTKRQHLPHFFFRVSGWLFNHSEMLFVLGRRSLEQDGDVSERVLCGHSSLLRCSVV